MLIYQSYPEGIDFWKEQERFQAAAAELAETLILPMVFRRLGETRASEAMLTIRFLSSMGYGPDGKPVGGNRTGLVRYQIGGSGSLEIFDYAKLKLHPEMQRALRYFDWGIKAASVGQYGDACMNYVRSLEALFGSIKKRGWTAIKRDCEGLRLNTSKVKYLMEKVRHKYAVAHVRDDTPGHFAKPEMKLEPDWRVESEARQICREATKAFWDSLPQPSDLDKLPFQYLYHGTRYLPPNVPKLQEAVAKLGLKTVEPD